MTPRGNAARLPDRGRRAARVLARAAVGVVLATGAAVAVAACRHAVSGPQMIHVQDGADSLAVTPDGRALFAASETDNAVTPVSLPGGTAGTPIKAGPTPRRWP